MSRKYKWLLFDADNTLLDFSAAEKTAIGKTFSDAGLPSDDETIAAYSRINDTCWKMLERGEITKTELRTRRFIELSRERGFSVDPEALADAYIENLKTQTTLCDGAYELCRSLYGKYDMYVITNGILAVQNARFGSCALSGFFISSFISDEIGCEKPSRGFFDAVAAAISDFDPARALVIGDSLTSDIKGGIDYGIDTCWYNPSGKCAPEGMNITYTVHHLSEIPGILE